MPDMQFLNYFLASLLAFGGLVIGYSLVRIAPEEKKPLSVYFAFARLSLIGLIFAFAMFYYFRDYFSLLVLAVYFVFIMLAEYRINDLLKKSIISYIFLGIVFYLSSKNMNLFAIESSLIMLYGVAAASLLYDKKKCSLLKMLFYSSGFLIIANALFFA